MDEQQYTQDAHSAEHGHTVWWVIIALIVGLAIGYYGGAALSGETADAPGEDAGTSADATAEVEEPLNPFESEEY